MGTQYPVGQDRLDVVAVNVSEEVGVGVAPMLSTSAIPAFFKFRPFGLQI